MDGGFGLKDVVGNGRSTNITRRRIMVVGILFNAALGCSLMYVYIQILFPIVQYIFPMLNGLPY